MMVPDSFSIFAPSSRVHIQIGEFISLDSWDFMCIMYIEIAELDCCQIKKKYIYVPSTWAYTHVLCLSLDLSYKTRQQSTLQLLKLYFITVAIECFRALNIKPSDWCCSVSKVWVWFLLKENKNFIISKTNSNTVGFKCQTCI